MRIIRYAGLVALLAASLRAQAMNSAAVNEVLKLKDAGLGEESILAFVQRSNVDYALSSDDLITLKNRGVSPGLLAAMLKSGTPTSGAAAAPIPGPAPTTAQPTVLPAPAPSTPPPGMGPRPTLVPTAVLSPDAAYFYQELSPYGRWIMAEDSQWYWQPTVAIGAKSWRPYWDEGRWVYTDSGWYWASDYPWGWAAFHYGRWRLHPLHGWVWMPDRVWAPAWVTWRTGAEYCGWAPLPPGTFFDNTGRLLYRGQHVSVDFDFGLDWNRYSFTRIRDLGEPQRIHFRRAEDRREMFRRTTVVNNFVVQTTMVENQPHWKVINRGIEPDRIAHLRGRPVETVTIQDLRAPTSNRSHERFDRERKTIEVYRPRWNEPGRH